MYGISERAEIAFNRVTNYGRTDTKVSMCELVAHADDLLPRDTRLLAPDGIGEGGNGFTDLYQVELDGVENEGVVEAATCHVRVDRRYRMEDVLELLPATSLTHGVSNPRSQ